MDAQRTTHPQHIFYIYKNWTFCVQDVLYPGHSLTGRFVTGRYVTGRFVGVPLSRVAESEKLQIRKSLLHKENFSLMQ
jgi:hypothetical protein